MKLSVVLATYNESATISECLKQVIGWCDEIIIVDGSSTDDTVEKAKKFKAKVFITSNQANFHINKQKAIDRATVDWILQLDADERVTEKLKTEISEVIKDKNVNGYWIPRKNYFLGRFLMKGGVYPDYTLRLYRRGKGKLPQKDVHEQTVVEGKVGYLVNPLMHYSDPTLRRYLIRFNRYTDFIAQQFLEKKEKKSILNSFNYLLLKPVYWFLLTYVRHLGFVDSWQGFIFAFFSALRFPVAYIKYLRMTL